MELLEKIWNVVEPVTYFFVILVFFKDPIRRWNFFGYRPTAVMGLFDPHLGKVLLAKANHAWAFNQGAIYDNNIYAICKDILQRELGISDTRFKLIYTRPLGTVRITNKHLLNRARISTISLFRHLRGKGYMACFIRINLKDIEKEIKMGAGVQDFRIVTYEEAKALVKEPTKSTNEHNSKKQGMILEMIDEIQVWAKTTKEWEEKFPMPSSNTTQTVSTATTESQKTT